MVLIHTDAQSYSIYWTLLSHLYIPLEWVWLCLFKWFSFVFDKSDDLSANVKQLVTAQIFFFCYVTCGLNQMKVQNKSKGQYLAALTKVYIRAVKNICIFLISKICWILNKNPHLIAKRCIHTNIILILIIFKCRIRIEFFSHFDSPSVHMFSTSVRFK